MLHQNDVEFALNEIDLSDKPEEFVELSPTGKVPMIVEDDFVLYESQVINDYLVERYDWDGAYADDLRLKYRQKVCIKQWDSIVLEPVYASLSDPDVLSENWEDIESELEYLADVTREVGDEFNSLFAYHFAPFWARFCWLSEYTSFPERVRSMDGLADWLDRTLEASAIEKTLPDPDWAREVYEENYVD